MRLGRAHRAIAGRRVRNFAGMPVYLAVIGGYRKLAGDATIVRFRAGSAACAAETVQNLGGLRCRAERMTGSIARPKTGLAEDWPVPIRRTTQILDGLSGRSMARETGHRWTARRRGAPIRHAFGRRGRGAFPGHAQRPAV